LQRGPTFGYPDPIVSLKAGRRCRTAASSLALKFAKISRGCAVALGLPTTLPAAAIKVQDQRASPVRRAALIALAQFSAHKNNIGIRRITNAADAPNLTGDLSDAYADMRDTARASTPDRRCSSTKRAGPTDNKLK